MRYDAQLIVLIRVKHMATRNQMDDVERQQIVQAFMHNLVQFVSKVGEIVEDTNVGHMEQVQLIGHELSDLRQASMGLHDTVLVESGQVSVN